jgi:8-oxo-dGTP diphosphatase
VVNYTHTGSRLRAKRASQSSTLYINKSVPGGGRFCDGAPNGSSLGELHLEKNVGVKGVVKVGDACLVLKKKTAYGGYFDIPGGRIDDEESLSEALMRKLSKELPTLEGYTVAGPIEAYRLSKNISEDKALVLIFYLIRAEPFEVRLSDEHDDYLWVTADTVKDLFRDEYTIEEGYYNAINRALMIG